MAKKDYPFIRAWGYDMGSSRSYINDQVAKAHDDAAPERAIYMRHSGEWVTVDNIVSDVTRRRIIKFAERYSDG